MLQEKAYTLEMIKTPLSFKRFKYFLKYSVPDFIEGNHELMKNILKLKDADIKYGGSGVFYIYLKKST